MSKANDGESQRYEYGSLDGYDKLDLDKRAYAIIPSNIILASDETSKKLQKRVSALSFFSLQKTMYNTVWFSINRVVEWCGSIPNRKEGSTNDKFMDAVRYLVDEGYISLSENYNLEDMRASSYSEVVFNADKIQDDTNRRGCEFAIIYLDEMRKIFDSDDELKDNYFNKDVLLLVFAYLRMKIYRRSNKMRIECVNSDGRNDHDYDVREWRRRYPESYNAHYKDIASDIGISYRMVSKAVSVLNELGLIYSEPLDRVEYEKDKWYTDHTLFCNYYKREGAYQFAYGRSYYDREINNKRNKLNEISRNKKACHGRSG